MSPREPSFSARVKDELLAVQRKKGCCRRAFADALALKDASGDRSALIEGEKMICQHCPEGYLAGLFVAFGSVSDPKRSHHMEFSMTNEQERDAVAAFLEKCGFPAKRGTRKGRYIAYIKRSGEIEDALAYAGAKSAVFEHINSAIFSGIRNDTNRRVNFDNANISKTVEAANSRIAAIKSLIDGGFLNELPAELREAAELRLE